MAKIRIYKSSNVNSYEDGGTAIDKDTLSQLLSMVGQTGSALVAPDNRAAANTINNVTSFAGMGTQIAPGIGTAIGAGVGGILSAIQGYKMQKEDARLNRQYVMNDQKQNTTFNRDIGLNPFITAYGGLIEQMYEGGIPIQAEKFQGQPEYIQTPDNDLGKTNATGSHETMGNEPTDIVPDNSFVFSARNRYTKSQWQAISDTLAAQGKQIDPRVLDLLISKSKKKTSPADMAERVDNLTSKTAAPSIFGNKAAQLNERNKKYLLDQITALNQAVNPQKQSQQNQQPQVQDGFMQAPWGGYFNNVNSYPDGGATTDCGSQVSKGLKNGNYIIVTPCNNGCVPDKPLPPNQAVEGQTYTTPCKPGGGGGGNGSNSKGADNTSGYSPDCVECMNKLIDGGMSSSGAKAMCQCDSSMQTKDHCSECVKNLEKIYAQTGAQKSKEDLQKECACGEFQSLSTSDCDACVKQFIANSAVGSNASTMSNIANSDNGALSKFTNAANQFKSPDISSLTEQARKHCNCPETADKKVPIEEDSGKEGNDSKLLYLKMLADSMMAGATMRQKMYDLSQFNMTPTLNMKDSLDPTGGINKIERMARNASNSLSGSLPFGMAAANIQGIHGQAGNQVGDYMSKLTEMNAGMYNQKQMAMQGQLDQNRQYVQNWLVDKTKRDNTAGMAPAMAMQNTTDAILQWYKDSSSLQGQKDALKTLMETLGITG